MEQKPFAAFLDLVTFDRTVHLLKLGLIKLSEEHDALTRRRAQVLSALDEAVGHVNELIMQVKEKELDIALTDQQEKEKRAKLSHLSEYRDIKALNAEIDTLKHAQIRNEHELMQFWNKLEHAQKELGRTKKQQEQELVVLDDEIQKHALLREQKQQDLDQIQQGRPAKEAIVPREWLESYSTMAARVSDPVVMVEYDACSGCFSAIAKQDLLRLERRAVIPCRLCFRLLYLARVMNLDQSSVQV